MKKMIFSAIAMMAFAGSAFASNEIVKEADVNNNVTIECLDSENIIEEDFVPCSVQIEYTQNGRTYVRNAYADVENGDGCSSFSDLVKGELSAQGYRIDGSIAISGAYITQF